MNRTLLDIAVSASGSPSDVKARIADQVSSAGASSPEQASALAVVRTYIDKKLIGVSEDDTLAVSATITISITDAPAIVTQKIAAAEERATVSNRVAEDLKKQLAVATSELATAKAALAEKPNDAHADVPVASTGV